MGIVVFFCATRQGSIFAPNYSTVCFCKRASLKCIQGTPTCKRQGIPQAKFFIIVILFKSLVLGVMQILCYSYGGAFRGWVHVVLLVLLALNS